MAAQLLPGYFLALLVIELMPFDFVVGRQELRVKYEENKVWEIGLLQVFVHDPDGLQIELNFHGALKKQDAPAQVS